MISFTYGEVCYLLGVLDELQARQPDEDRSDLTRELEDASEILSSAIALQYQPASPPVVYKYCNHMFDISNVCGNCNRTLEDIEDNGQ